jgi:hypothetical protein
MLHTLQAEEKYTAIIDLPAAHVTFKRKVAKLKVEYDALYVVFDVEQENAKKSKKRSSQPQRDYQATGKTVQYLNDRLEADFEETRTSIEQGNESHITALTQQHAVAVADSEELFETLREECGTQLEMLVDSDGNHLVKFRNENESETKLLRKSCPCITMYRPRLQDVRITDLGLKSALLWLVTWYMKLCSRRLVQNAWKGNGLSTSE